MVTTTSATGSAATGQAARAQERPHEIVAAYLDELLSGGDFGQFLSEDVTFTLMDTGEITRGREAVVGLISYQHEGAFDATPEFRAPIVAGDYGMIEAVFVATHIGEFAGIAPTNRRVRVPYAVAYELAGDSIAAIRIYLPMDALVRQLRDA